MKEQNQVRPGLPPDARAEILETLSANMEIGSDEMRGLDATAGKVRVRIRVLDRLKSVLMQGKRRKAG